LLLLRRLLLLRKPLIVQYAHRFTIAIIHQAVLSQIAAAVDPGSCRHPLLPLLLLL
jgi:hypothetical protein